MSSELEKNSGIDCPARMLREEDLHAEVLTAVNDAWSQKADIIPALKVNIKAVLDGGVEDAIAEIDGKIKEKQQELQERLEDLDNFLDEQTEAITEYSEVLVRRLIEKITVYDEKLVVEFKSGLQIEVEA